MRFDCIHCRKATTKPQSVKGAFLRMLTIVRQADRLAQQRYGSNSDNPNNLVNRIAGRYLGSFNRSGTSWNTQVSKRTYMGLNDG